MRISDWSSDVCSSDLQVGRFDQITAIVFWREENRRAGPAVQEMRKDAMVGLGAAEKCDDPQDAVQDLRARQEAAPGARQQCHRAEDRAGARGRVANVRLGAPIGSADSRERGGPYVVDLGGG